MEQKSVEETLNSLTEQYGYSERWELATEVLPRQLQVTDDERESGCKIYATWTCKHEKPDATVYVQIRSDGVRLLAKYTDWKLVHWYRAASSSCKPRNYAAEVRAAYETWRCPAKRKLFV